MNLAKFYRTCIFGLVVGFIHNPAFADFTATQGSGITIASNVVTSKHYQALNICDPTVGETQCAGINASGQMAIAGPVTNTGTFAVQAAQSGTWNITTVTTVSAVTAITNALPAGTNLLGKVGIDQTTPGTTNGVSLAQVGSTTVATGNGVTGAGSQRVTIASDNTAFAVNATLSAETTKVIGTVRIASGGVASGSYASGSIASGAYASGAFASGSGVDGWDVTEGTKADTPCTVPTSATACSMVAVLKGIANASSSPGTTFAQGGATAPTNAALSGMTYNSGGVAPTTGQSVALQSDAAGNLKVAGAGILDTSAFSQPTTQGSGILGLVNTSARSALTNNTMSYLSLDATAALRVSIVSGGGSGGTSSNFGSAFPTPGTAIGLSDGTNMLAWRASNYGTSPGAVTVAGVNAFVTNTVAENITQVAGATISATNPLFTNISVASAAISATNPLFTNISVGSTAISATNGLFANILQGNAVISVGNPSFSRVVAGATGGASTTGNISVNNVTAVVVKSGAGTLYGIQVYGIGSAPAYIKFYNATSATCGSGTPVKRIMIPAASTAANGAGSNVTFGSQGVAFSTGITYCVTTGITDADTTAPAANTFLYNIDWN